MPCGRLRGVFQTLRFRLTAWNTAVVLLLMIVTLVGIRAGVRHTLLDELDELLKEDTLEIQLTLRQTPPDEERLYRVLERKAQGHVQHGWFVQLFDVQGRLLWANQDAPALAGPEPNVKKMAVSDDPPFRLMQTRIDEPNMAPMIIRVGCSQEYIANAVEHLTRNMLLAGVVILLLAPLGGYWLAGRAIQPVAQIITTTAKLQPSNLAERLPIRKTGDELDQLSHTINAMLDRIASYLKQNRDFVANAAHELRSPLTAIHSSVEVALNCERSTDEYTTLLAEVMEECSSLCDLVNRLLVLAEGDAGRLNADGQRTQLDRVVHKSISMFHGVAESREVSLEAPRLASAQVPGDEHYLRHVVHNLIDNAIKFTPAGGRVTVELRTDPDRNQAVLCVADTGVGIPADNLPHLFERFYRGDTSRGHTDGIRGHGLGLSICYSVVMALGGTILVQSAPGEGSKFTVCLPLTSTRLPPSAGE